MQVENLLFWKLKRKPAETQGNTKSINKLLEISKAEPDFESNLARHYCCLWCSTCPLVFGCWELSHVIFSRAEKERTACKAEQIHKMTTIVTQNGPKKSFCVQCVLHDHFKKKKCPLWLKFIYSEKATKFCEIFA